MSNVIAQIEAADDRRESTIEIPEWGISVVLREPVMEQVRNLRNKYLVLSEDGQTANAEKSDLDGFNWALISLMVHEEEGDKIFENGKQAEEVLGKKSSRVVAGLVEKCANMAGGITEAEAEGN